MREAPLIRAIQSGFVGRPRVFRTELVNGHRVWCASTAVSLVQTFPGADSPVRIYLRVASGSHPLRATAIRKSLMEALERRAFEACANDPHLRSAYGFDLCSDTTGMAAHWIGGHECVRPLALKEATERWVVSNWWDGALRATPLRVRGMHQHERGIQIHAAVPFKTVLTWIDSCFGRAYGFAADETLERAHAHAHVELSRNVQALGRGHSLGLVGVEDSVACNLQEQRLLYFASPDGVQDFDDRVGCSVSPSKWSCVPGPKQLLLDTEVVGPWSEFARVWRCLWEGTRWLKQDSRPRFAF
jgi:hypothetical protein